MGAAGFEPATTWSEAKHSVQTELSARSYAAAQITHARLQLNGAHP